jgi:hypothetical protein
MFHEIAVAIMMEVHYCSSGFWTSGNRHGFATRYGSTSLIRR